MAGFMGALISSIHIAKPDFFLNHLHFFNLPFLNLDSSQQIAAVSVIANA